MNLNNLVRPNCEIYNLKNPNGLKGGFDEVAEPTNKAVGIGNEEFLSIINKGFKTGFGSLAILNETITSTYMGQLFNTFNPFFETINKQTSYLLEAGVVSRCRELYVELNRKVEDIGPQVLTMEHLEIGFLACAILLTLSCIAFIGELLVAHSAMLLRFMRNCFISRSVVKALLKLNRSF